MKAGVLTLTLIRKLLLDYMPTLPEGRVNFYNQKFKIPDDPNLFVTLSYTGSKIYANRSNYNVNNDPQYNETIDLAVMESISINLMSKNLQALQVKEFFVMALTSYASEQIQEANGFKIFNIAPINDLSSLEGAAELFRFEIPIKLLAWYQNVTLADYYNVFDFSIIVDPVPVMTYPWIPPVVPSGELTTQDGDPIGTQDGDVIITQQ